jgi:hypothetical protein
MQVLRVARLTTMWTKAEHRDPLRKEPVFRAGDRMTTRVRVAGGVATLPEVVGAADLLVVEEDDTGTRLVPLRGVEGRWALFGLRMAAELELWLRTKDDFFYGVPRRAEYRLAVLRPGEVTRVLHNAKNDFAAASGRERTYRWNDFVIEHLGMVTKVQVGVVAEDRVIPLDRAKTVDLREDLL